MSPFSTNVLHKNNDVFSFCLKGLFTSKTKMHVFGDSSHRDVCLQWNKMEQDGICLFSQSKHQNAFEKLNSNVFFSESMTQFLLRAVLCRNYFLSVSPRRWIRASTHEWEAHAHESTECKHWLLACFWTSKLKRWQGPPNITKVQQYETVLSLKFVFSFTFVWHENFEVVYLVCLGIK